MKPSERKKILKRAKDFFLDEIVVSHVETACQKASSLKSYNVNPFLLKYLANFLKGGGTARDMAEALVLPRVLGTSISTSFGMRIQKMVGVLFKGYGSTTSGIDIEYTDHVDGRRKYCQVKSGPNTINHDDVQTIIGHFQAVRNLARTNNLNIGVNDLTVGVLYGTPLELSSHYKSIDKEFPVLVGQDFWTRITGDKEFYKELINAIGEVALEVDGQEVLESTIVALEKEIKVYYPF